MLVKNGGKSMFGNKLNKISKMVEKNQAENLEKLLKDKKPEVVLAAIDALGQCTGDVPFNALVPLILSPDVQVRVHAVKALGVMGLPKARTFLLHQKDMEKEPAVLTAIEEALKKISVKV